jgi:diaminopropionate ammonia-lyase
MGLLTSLLRDDEYQEAREAIHLDENSEVLLISTEGNTDPIRFREVVWDGLYGMDKTHVK